MASKTLKTPKAHRTRKEILEAAIQCFIELGIEKSSISEIATASGKSRGLVAHYFPKKADLFLQVMDYIVGQFQDLGEKLEADQSWEANVEANFSFFAQNPNYFKCIILLYYYAGVHKKYRELNTTIIKRTLFRLETALLKESKGGKTPLEKIEAKRLALLIHRILLASLQQYFAMEHGMSLPAFKRQVFELISSAIQP